MRSGALFNLAQPNAKKEDDTSPSTDYEVIICGGTLIIFQINLTYGYKKLGFVLINIIILVYTELNGWAYFGGLLAKLGILPK